MTNTSESISYWGVRYLYELLLPPVTHLFARICIGHIKGRPHVSFVTVTMSHFVLLRSHRQTTCSETVTLTPHTSGIVVILH